MKHEARRARTKTKNAAGLACKWLFVAAWIPAALLFAEGAAADNRVYLAAPGGVDPVESRTVGAGESFTLDLRMDFDDRTVGGGVLVRYDRGLLRLDEVRFDEALGDDASLRCPADPGTQAPISCPATADTISFGGVAGLAGERRVASLAFSAIGAGTTPLGVSRAHAFSDVRGRELAVVTVPEPGFTLQLVSGALCLAALSRRSLR